MGVRVRLSVFMMGVALSIGLTGLASRAQAQDNQHVVSLGEINKAAAQPAETRHADETAVRQLFSSSEAQDALKSAKVDYQKVDKAIGQLSDEDLAKVAERSRQAQNDFAAGSLSRPGWIAILVLVAVLIIVLAVVF